jgi:hypothetical protein
MRSDASDIPPMKEIPSRFVDVILEIRRMDLMGSMP